MFDSLEVLLTLYFMGGPVTLKKAVILKSLGTAISVAAYFVPESWGAQEGGYILIGQMLSLPATPFALVIIRQTYSRFSARSAWPSRVAGT